MALLKKYISTKKIDLKKVEEYASNFKNYFFPADSKLLYEGQKPIAAILIINGAVKVIKDKKTKVRFCSNTLILFEEFANQEELLFDIEVSTSTTVCWIDKENINGLLSA